jgi:hypothetical protein
MSSPAHLGYTLASALNRSEPLGGLLQRVRESQERLATIAPLMPAALNAGVRAGPLDEAGWQLLVDNAATAAKVRQWLPKLESALTTAGWRQLPIKIKVLPRD